MTRSRRERRGALGRLFGAVSVLALSAGLLVATPAAAGEIDPGDIGDMVVPTEVPEWVYRADLRPWNEIAPVGFRPIGSPGSWNENLADHLLALERPSNSAWVSTSEDESLSVGFGKDLAVDKEASEFWLYKVAPGDNFSSMQISMREKMLADPAFASELDDLKSSFFGDLEAEAEWSAFGGIPSNNVQSAQKYSLKIDDWGDRVAVPEGAPVQNSSFARPPNKPTLEAKKIESTTTCSTRAECALAPADEAAAEEMNADRFAGDLEGNDFTLRPDDLSKDEDLLLAPLPESITVVDEYSGTLHTPAEFDTFTTELNQAFTKDLSGLAGVSANGDVLDAVAAASGAEFEAGSELVPYLGIAATGYALKKDIDAGQWGDAAADAIAEILQIAMTANPEFAAFLEPLLIADLVAQLIGDAVWSWSHPAPQISDEQRDHIDKASDAIDTVAPTLSEIWDKERIILAKRYFLEHVEKGQNDLVVAKVKSDLATMRSLYDATREEIMRHHSRATAYATSPEERFELARLRSWRIDILSIKTQEAMKARVDQYKSRLGVSLDAQAKATLVTEFADARARFIKEQTQEFLFDATQVMWQAVFPGRIYADQLALHVRGFGSFASELRSGAADTLRLRDEYRTAGGASLITAAERESLVASLRTSIDSVVAEMKPFPPPPTPELPDPGPGGPEFRYSFDVTVWQVAEGTVTMVGTGPVGTRVQPLFGDPSLPSVTIGTNGRWTTTVHKPNHLIAAVAFYKPGETSVSAWGAEGIGCFSGEVTACDPFTDNIIGGREASAADQAAKIRQERVAREESRK